MSLLLPTFITLTDEGGQQKHVAHPTIHDRPDRFLKPVRSKTHQENVIQWRKIF